MRICVFGAGSIGGHVAGSMLALLIGQPVSAVAEDAELGTLFTRAWGWWPDGALPADAGERRCCVSSAFLLY